MKSYINFISFTMFYKFASFSLSYWMGQGQISRGSLDHKELLSDILLWFQLFELKSNDMMIYWLFVICVIACLESWQLLINLWTFWLFFYRQIAKHLSLTPVKLLYIVVCLQKTLSKHLLKTTRRSKPRLMEKTLRPDHPLIYTISDHVEKN